MIRKRGPTRGEAHVRLYKHEIESAAYRSLSPEARSLLVEFRALYPVVENCVHMSTREAMRRLGVGQFRAEKARHELLDRGFIRVLESGSFSLKARHATTFALTHEPLSQRDGDTAPKDFMTWTPQKNTVRVTSTESRRRQPKKRPTVRVTSTENSKLSPTTVRVTATQISYQGVQAKPDLLTPLTKDGEWRSFRRAPYNSNSAWPCNR